MHDLHEPQTIQDEPHFPGDIYTYMTLVMLFFSLPDAYITQQIILYNYTNTPTLKFYVEFDMAKIVSYLSHSCKNTLFGINYPIG